MSDERLDAISEALARIVRRQGDIEARLERLESTLGSRDPADPEHFSDSKPILSPAAIPQANAPISAVAAEPVIEPVESVPATPPPLPPYAPPAAPPVSQAASFETRVGLNWVNRIGVITLIFGVGYGFKYAVDNQWIGLGLRVALGVAGGMASLSLGEWFSMRAQTVFARGMTGLGLGLLYLSFYASYGFYDLLSLSSAFLLMSATTVAAGALAFHYNSSAVAVLGLIGGFLTPALLASNQDRLGTLTAYTLMLSLGALVLARIRRWPVLAYLSLAGTYLLYSGWSNRWLEDSTRMAAFTWLTLAFALFFVFTRSMGLWLLPLNAALYFAASYASLDEHYHRSMGAFTAALGILHAAYAGLVTERTHKQLSLAIALVFFTLAIPIQFDGYRITIAWAVEAAVCAWLARRFENSRLDFATGVLLVLVFFRLLGTDTAIYAGQFWNVRLLTFVISAASFWIASQWLKVREAKAILYCGGHAILLWALSLEVAGWAQRNATDVSSATATGISILLTAYAIGLIWAGVATGAAIHRLLGLGLIGIVILKLYLVDIWALGLGFRIVAFLGLGAMLLLVSYLYSRFKPAIEKLWKNPLAEAPAHADTVHDPESGAH